MAKPKFDTFHTGRPGLRKILGDLEAAIMEAVWRRGPGARITVRDIVDDLKATRGSAYTTVMTVMGILTQKELLRVEKGGGAHSYQAAVSRAEFADLVVGKIVRELLADFTGPALAHFAQAIANGSSPVGVAKWLERIQAQRKAES
ncbi:MAG: BlaI/MecI/CopY family transcriptional regulator [Cyanobacteria bacterium NC_groundwater_1444_Ag_S-0.65um_54_12]|nr:BlaI/MecI/CopY family transcriptional regulator [Cyanobacteria bacterium NC_groundwater_1444_Ag_S-0.65um_54_12]